MRFALSCFIFTLLTGFGTAKADDGVTCTCPNLLPEWQLVYSNCGANTCTQNCHYKCWIPPIEKPPTPGRFTSVFVPCEANGPACRCVDPSNEEGSIYDVCFPQYVDCTQNCLGTCSYVGAGGGGGAFQINCTNLIENDPVQSTKIQKFQ